MPHFPSAVSCIKTGVLQSLAGVLSLMLQKQRNGNKESCSGVFLFLAVSFLVEIIALKKKIENDFRTLSAESGGSRTFLECGVPSIAKEKKIPALHQYRREKKVLNPAAEVHYLSCYWTVNGGWYSRICT